LITIQACRRWWRPTITHHDHSGDGYATFRFLGTEGLIKGTIGLLYNYPHGRPDTLQVHSNRLAPETWFDIKLEGLWIPDAFIGPIASLMDAIQRDGTPITNVTDNLSTLRVVHAAYRSAAENRSVRPADL
jgi:predicted dehydrogenase